MPQSSWQHVARRIRVPVGFLFTALYLWLARPAWWSLAVGGAIVLPGLALRAIASGYVQKNRVLTTGGPYAHTRNPLYMGSVVIAVGFAVAARSLWTAIAIVILFLAIYFPVVLAEEEHLRSEFPEYADYARAVPRFLPRLSAAGNAEGAFSHELYLKHREYNALLGASILMLAMAAKILWFNR